MFDALARLKEAFSEMSAFSEAIFGSFVIPASQIEDPPLAAMMNLIAKLRGGWVEFDWLIQAAIPGLTSWDSDLNVATIRALIRVFRELDTDRFHQLMRACGAQVLGALFHALTDAMHKAETHSYVKLLRKMCLFVADGKPIEDEWRQLIVAVLLETAEEPEQGFFVEFVNHICGCATEAEYFREAVVKFLILIKKLSPGDQGVFKAKVITGPAFIDEHRRRDGGERYHEAVHWNRDGFRNGRLPAHGGFQDPAPGYRRPPVENYRRLLLDSPLLDSRYI
jgi:hypothetical protein